MKATSEQDRHNDADALARRRRIAMSVGRVVELLAGAFWMWLFVMALQTGYLSRIGIVVGALFAGSVAISPLLGWAGRRRLEWACSGVHVGIIALFILSWAKASLWPENTDGRRPYRFDDELAAIEAGRAIPEVENAALRYDSLFARMDRNDEPNFLFSDVTLRGELGTRPWKGDDHPQASQWLDSQAGLIDELLNIGRTEKCRWPVQADTYDEYTVPYETLRHSVKLLLVAGNRDLGEGRVGRALEEYFCILRIADHLRQQPSMVDSASACGHERCALQMVRYALVQSDLSHESIAEIAAHLPTAADPWPDEWTELLEHEKLRYMNLLGRLYEVSADGTIQFTTDPAISPGDWQARAIRFPRLYWLMSMPRDPHDVHRIVDRCFAEFDPVVRSQDPIQSQSSEITWTSPGDTAKLACNFFRWWAEMAFFNERAYVDHRQRRLPAAITARRGTWLVLGLRRYRDAHGTWPQTLDRIMEYVPAEAFVDPMAGEHFVYAHDGNSFKLYSKGPNRVDEGGRHGYVKALGKSEDDIPLWPPAPPQHSRPMKNQ